MKEKRSWFKKNLPWLIPLTVVLLVCFGVAFFLYRHWACTAGDTPNDKASYFSNVFSPFIAMAAAVITFAAFWIQYQTNNDLRTSLEKQERELEAQKRQQSIDRFEKIFFEMVHIHRENVLGFVIHMKDGKTVLHGNAALAELFREVNDTYRFLKHSKQHQYATELASYDDHKLIRLAYELAWEGHPKDRDGNYMDVALDCKDRSQGKAGILSELHELHRGTTTDNKGFLSGVKGLFTSSGQGALPAASAPTPTLPKDYPLGAGTKHALSAYYRHFYHTCKFLNEEHGLKGEAQEIQEQKEKYAGILRAQISDEAQGLLYYNSLYIRTDIWWGLERQGEPPHGYPGLLMHLKLLRNAPLDQIDEAISPLTFATQWLKNKKGIATPSRKDLADYFTYLGNKEVYKDSPLAPVQEG